MQTRPFLQIDVFTSAPGLGNPLAVVLDASGLDTDAMQRIAAWTNVVETTFVLPPTDPAASYRVRIFTPRRELAFAGHPSIGTAHAVLEAGLARPQPVRNPRGGFDPMLVQECGAGLLPLRVEGEGESRALFVQAPATQVLARHEADDASWCGALGLRLGASGAALIDGGRRWWVAELADEDAVRGFRPDFAAIAALIAPAEAIGLALFARCHGNDYRLVVRALMPLPVPYEDPASGAANAALAGYLHATGQADDLGLRYVVSQGREVGRDARLTLHLDDGRGWVGGPCRTVIAGELRW